MTSTFYLLLAYAVGFGLFLLYGLKLLLDWWSVARLSEPCAGRDSS